MIVVCTNLGEGLEYKTNTDGLTIGKSYDVIISNPISFEMETSPGLKAHLVGFYYIKNDFGVAKKYNQSLFLKLEEWREKQLGKLL
jgi:hypothetical protein